MAQVTLLDTNAIINIFGRNDGAFNEEMGFGILNDMARSGPVGTTSTILTELENLANNPASGVNPDVANAFADWAAGNGNAVVFNTPQAPGSNGGEASLEYVMSNSTTYAETYDVPQLAASTSNVAIVSDDTSDFAGTPYEGNQITTVEAMQTNLLNGTTSVDTYNSYAAANNFVPDANHVIAAELNNSGISASVDDTGQLLIDGQAVDPHNVLPNASQYSDVGGALGESGSQAAATDASFQQASANSGGSLEALAKLGLAAMALDLANSFTTAGEQYDQGNHSGAAQTLAAAQAQLAFGFAGGAIGSIAGADALAGAMAALEVGGVIAAGAVASPALIAAAALIGAVAVGAAAAQYGSEIGALAAQLSPILGQFETALAQAMGNMELAIANRLDHLETPGVTNELIAAGNWMSGKMASIWGTAMATGSPLVLDLSSGGTGITLSAPTGTGSVLWDFGTHFLHQSGWVTGTTGLLCIDPTGTGVITQADLFGNEPANGIPNGQAANGFQALAAFDSNHDGVINSSDANFNELRVWVPSVNTDAVATPGSGELYTLAQLGITSIDLNYANEDYQINGNFIEQQSTFVINGNTQTIADAWFSYDPLNTIYDGSYTLNPEVLFLPDQRGYGQLPELAIAMSLDSTLLGEVQSLASHSFAQLMNPSFGLENALKTILFEWAGAESVDPTVGGIVNSQELQFVEQLMGQNIWNQTLASTTSTNWDGSLVASHLNQAWDVAFSYITAHLLAQAGFNGLMGRPTYDPVSDSLYDASGNPFDVAVQFADQALGGFELPHMATNDIFVLFPGDSPVTGPESSPTIFIEETPRGGGTNTLALGVAPPGVVLSDDYSGNLYVHYTATDTVEIIADTAYSSGYHAGTIVGEYVQQIAFEDGTLWSLTGGLHLTATTTYDQVFGTAMGGDTLDGSAITGAVLTGYTGNETYIIGDATTVNAGNGTNTYVVNADSCPSSDGGATINPNASATGDHIVLHGVTESQVFLSDNSSGELLISTSNGDLVTVTGGSYDFFGAGVTLGNIAGITLDDSTVLNLTGIVTLTPTAPGSLLGISTGTDFVANGYENSFNGFNSHDVFSFTAGSAPVASFGDYIHEYATGGNSTIAFHGLTPSAVVMSDDNSGDLIFQFGTDLVTVSGGGYTSSGMTVGNLQQATFDDSTVWNLQSGLHLTAASDYQYLYGTASGGDTLTASGTNDHLYAYGGSDTLVAGTGTDLHNGTGNDTDVFSTGFGSDTIYANASGGSSNTIEFHGVTAADLAISDDVYGQLTIQDTSGDQLLVSGGSYSSTTGFSVGNIEQIALDGGTDINLTGGLHLTAASNYQYLYGTAGGGDTLTADGTSDNLWAYGGTETLVAGVLTSLHNGTGNDTDVFSAGFGSATLYANASGGSSNTIAFHGVTAADLAISDDVYGQLTIEDTSTSDQILVSGGSYSSTTGFSVGNIEQIALDGGIDINLTGSLNLTSTSDNQFLYGTGFGDEMTALGNNDHLYAIAGNNTMTGNSSSSSSTYFNGGSGNDLMIAEGGTNYMNAGAGADTYSIANASSSTTVTGFSEAKGDVLSFENILEGTSVLSNVGNYVQETTSGGNTQFSVDPTGTGNFAAGPLVTLNGVTGLEDVATMIAHGHLLVHS